MMSRRRFGVPTPLYIFSAVIFIAAFFAVTLVVRNLTSAFNRQDTALKAFEIKKGESVDSVAARLGEQELVRSPLGFKIAVKKEGLGNRIQAGIYQLSPSMTAAEMAQALTKGYAADVKITIPEGYRNEEIAETVEKIFRIPAADFEQAAGPMTGNLFPDTYYFAPEATATEIVAKMQDNFRKKTAALNITPETLILASLIERETKADAEKPIVAGILLKRLANNWPLQLDATVQYVAGRKGNWWPNTTLLDRQRPSTFNTYLHTGLPPAPIANPGLKSIEAAVKPEESVYWFYLHDRGGVIRYAETSAAHEQNIEEYIR